MLKNNKTLKHPNVKENEIRYKYKCPADNRRTSNVLTNNLSKILSSKPYSSFGKMLEFSILYL